MNSEDLLSSLLEKDKLRGEGGRENVCEEELPSRSKVVDAGVKASERLPKTVQFARALCVGTLYYITGTRWSRKLGRVD